MSTNAQFGAFIPTTDVYDVFNNTNPDPQGDDLKLFLVRLRQSINNVALTLNIKDSGYYLPAEFLCGQLYFPATTTPTNKTPTFRQVYRMVVDFGPLGNNTTVSVPHNIPDINSEFSFTRMYATASDQVALTYLPIPTSTALGEIYLDADATNVNITTTFDATAYTIVYVVLEYLKY